MKCRTDGRSDAHTHRHKGDFCTLFNAAMHSIGQTINKAYVTFKVVYRQNKQQRYTFCIQLAVATCFSFDVLCGSFESIKNAVLASLKER